MKLDPTVKMVVVQFTLTNADAIPQVYLDYKFDEAPSEAAARFGRHSGERVTQSVTDRCTLHDVQENLNREGYFLVDDFYQKRIAKEGSRRQNYVVRFSFVREEFLVDRTEEEIERMVEALKALRIMSGEAIWRCRVDNNPYFQDGVAVPGQRAISIGAAGRHPLLNPDGTSVMEWKKDSEGRRIGDAPVPLEPVEYLQIENSEVAIVAI